MASPNEKQTKCFNTVETIDDLVRDNVARISSEQAADLISPAPKDLEDEPNALPLVQARFPLSLWPKLLEDAYQAERAKIEAASNELKEERRLVQETIDRIESHKKFRHTKREFLRRLFKQRNELDTKLDGLQNEKEALRKEFREKAKHLWLDLQTAVDDAKSAPASKPPLLGEERRKTRLLSLVVNGVMLPPYPFRDELLARLQQRRAGMHMAPAEFARLPIG